MGSSSPGVYFKKIIEPTTYKVGPPTSHKLGYSIIPVTFL